MLQPREVTLEFLGSCAAYVAFAWGKLGFALIDSLRRLDTEALRLHNEHAFKG